MVQNFQENVKYKFHFVLIQIPMNRKMVPDQEEKYSIQDRIKHFYKIG